MQAPARVEEMEGIVYNRGRVKLSAPTAPGQAADVDGWCWAHRWRRRKTETRERERETARLRESLRYGRSDRQRRRKRGERYLLHGLSES